MKRKKWQKYQKYIVIGIGIIGVGVCSLLYTESAVQTASVASVEKKSTIYPRQYSDTHITENAKVTDPRLNNLAKINKESLLASAASSPVMPNTLVREITQSEKGTWLWTPTLGITPAYRDSIIAGAKRDGIRNFYLSIDSYLDIYVMPDGREKEAKKKTFDDTLESFITAAHKNNMTVDAEAGWRNWAEPGNEYKSATIINYVLEFNATHTEKFRGLQYDVEPYLLDSYATDPKTVLHNFLDLINRTVTQLKSSDLAFSVVIPDFYDGESGESPRLFYAWNYSYTLTHLLNILEHRPGSTILIMAYRNFSKGPDGSIAISQNEIRKANNYHTKVIVAQETGEILPPYITFHNTSLASLNLQIENIQDAFVENKSYNGIAIHYINALMQLE
ncbi:MAG: hypothetical protein WC887_02745 [Candidatus Paceibacterota bacterium]|jgi:hypothetical protein